MSDDDVPDQLSSDGASAHRECLERARRALAGTGWEIERRVETSGMRAG
ncbi:hypothetical protein [Amycolatopsis echigonensis]|uniref:Uncharacterized protein n=1 Tax=Amycolatopsis echigonensis TaxID=2576905 RepID=A0A8E1VZE3_9PSEU|nr:MULTISPECIES: hypothetical protein [Amycolatopsis]MBB2501205.1 hypothetical protein [Amycolatopsis echigonensis]